MLSIYTLKSASDAFTYYQQGDYYTTEGVEGHSFWFGKGAESLHLSGAVDFDIFKELLKGQLPDGSLMTNVARGEYHRPGYDLTFSAPKSVSILALIGGNAEILQAFRESVQEVLVKIEEKYGACRNKEQGTTKIEKTGNMVFAVFEHADTRAGDPGLHDHCVLMNMTKRGDAQWRTLFADEIYTDKLLNGMEQRSILAHKLLALGHPLRMGEKGTFEIAAVPESLIDFYSKRHEEITAWLKERKLSGGAAAKIANFQTRLPKKNLDPSERIAHWMTELNEAGFTLDDLEKIGADAKTRGAITLPNPVEIAKASIDTAISHLEERKSFFSMQDVMKSAKMLSIFPSNDADFLHIIEQKIKDKTLIYSEEKLLTTPANKLFEAQNSVHMQKSKNTVDNIMAGWIFDTFHASKHKTETARAALKFMLTTHDQQVLVSTNSKPLLNEMLKVFNAICQNQHHYPRFLTEKASTAEFLKQKLNTDKAMTIEGFILACEMRTQKQNPNPNIIERWNQRFRVQEARDIWVVHNNASFSQVSRLQQYAKTFGARLIFTQPKYQDVRSLASLAEQGISQYQLSVPEYYKTELQTKDTLLATLNRMDAKYKLHSHTDYQERLHLAAELSLLERTLPLLVTLTNGERLALNEQVRAGLKQKNFLGQNAVTLPTLQALSLSHTEKSQPNLYQPGDIIRFNVTMPETLFDKRQHYKGRYFEVLSVDLSTSSMTLQDMQQHRMTWNPKTEQNLKQVEVFRVAERELRIGDKLVWTRTLKDTQDKTLNRIKNQSAFVVTVAHESVTVALQNGKMATFNPRNTQQQHWDYGYAVLLKNRDWTLPKETVLVLQSDKIDTKTLTTLQESLEHLQENKKAATVVCNDIAKLKETIAAGGIGNMPERQSEIPYLRHEALSEHQTTVTQPVFHGLQGEFLKANQLNPEFSAENLANNKEVERDYSPQFRRACDVVDQLCLYHAERDAVLDLKMLKLEAAQLGGLKIPMKCIEGAFDLAIEKEWLIPLPKKLDSDKDTVTTRHTLLMEKLCIQKMTEGKNQLAPIMLPDAPALKNLAAASNFTRSQKKAVHLVLTTSDRFVAVQGIAGAGKTTALKELNQQCLALGFKTLVLANTGVAKNQAQHSSGMNAMTTAAFLTKLEPLLTKDVDKAKQDYGNNQLIIMDEASFVSTPQMFKLETVINQLNARLCWTGDFKQTGSIGQGDAFGDTLAYGIQHVAMIENVRLNSPTALAALKSAYAGDMEKTLHFLQDRIEEIPVKAEALQKLVETYFLVRDLKKTEPVVITPLNQDRKIVNDSIRAFRKEKNELTGDALKTPVYLPTDRREIEKKNIETYQSTDVIRFSTHHPRLGVKAGDYVTVLAIDTQHHRLHLKNENNQTFYWSPKNLQKPSDIEIYKQETREFLCNDTIIFRRNNEAEGIFNGDKAVVLKVEKSNLTVALENDQIITVDLAQKANQHLDYGYALTPSATQGRNIKHVIAYGGTPKPYPRKTAELKVGNIVIVPKSSEKDASEPTYSKLGEVVALDGHHLTVSINGHLKTILTKKEEIWEYFPPFEDRQDHELPLSTSQQSFLVAITRGDWFYLITANANDFQKTLEKHVRMKESALSHSDLNWQRLHKSINRLVENISGKAEVKELEPSVLNNPPVQKKLRRSFSTPQKPKGTIDKNALNAHLERNVLEYATTWLGNPSKKNAKEARWGSKGAMCVNLSGSKAGLWKNHETGEGGKGLISLYMAIHSVDFKTALKELGHGAGLSNQEFTDRDYKPKAPERNLKAEQALLNKRINYAQQQYQKTLPLKGTLAEKYLSEFRGITGELPSHFRFSPGIKHLDTQKLTPALVAPIHNKDNQITAIVRIFLNSDGSKLRETYKNQDGELKNATDKANLGVSSNGAVIVQKGLSRTVWIAEGVETALSVAKAMPGNTVMASLSISQLKNMPVSDTIQTVVICADNDPPSAQGKKNISDAVSHYLSLGKQVFVTMPPEIPAGIKKYDFNDLLKQGGLSRVREVLDTRVEIKSSALLNNLETSLLNDLKKIEDIGLEKPQKSCPVSPKKEIQLEK
jgi:conjugative relaxase-like TrwC/TraI family protein